MIEIPKQPVGVRAYWFNLHKSIGMTIGLLVLVRLAWRLTHRPPPLPASVPAWQRGAAAVNHALLYGCLIAMPVVGFFGSSFSGYPIRYFALTLPQLFGKSEPLKELCSVIHLGLAWATMALIALHVLAALKHRWVDRDGVFQRMWPTAGSAADPRARTSPVDLPSVR
jgi:cytochrome b561